MIGMYLVGVFAIGLALGVLLAYLYHRPLHMKLIDLEKQPQMLGAWVKELSSEALKSAGEELLSRMQNSLEHNRSAQKSDLAIQQQALQHYVSPIREALEKFDTKVKDLELARATAYEGLTQQIRALLDAQQFLRQETGQLVSALKSPQVRGRWGEIQLRRVVELSGMLNRCDFAEQVSVQGEDGLKRPDLVIQLPGNRQIVVDSKVSLAGYLDYLAAKTPDERMDKMKEHAGQLRRSAEELGKKKYWSQFAQAPDFVILFTPGEVFLGAALEVDTTLLEDCAESRVLIATPMTLIAMLKAIAYGWKGEGVSENAQKISALGKELHKRLADLGSHVQDMGSKLKGAVDGYNRMVGTLESRVFVSARRFRDFDAVFSDTEIANLDPVELSPRAPQVSTPEMSVEFLPHAGPTNADD